MRLNRVVGAAVAALFFAASAAADTAPPERSAPLQLLGISPGMLLTPDMTLHARVSPDSGDVAGIGFAFQPRGSETAIPIGVDRTPIEPSFGPDCGERGCFKTDEYSVAIGDALDRVPEGDGAIVAFIEGDPDRPIVTGRVYWDETPPIARFVTPRFGAHTQKNGLEVVAHSKDENLVAVKVSWSLVPVGTRPIPEFEQHLLGAALTPGGHASCVPTSAAANFQWLVDTSQWNVYPQDICGVANPACFVGVLGLLMGTGVGGGGTSGSGFEQGIIDYLDFEFGYERDVDYTLEHPSTASGGFSPEKLVEEFAAGGVVNVGLHNTPMDPGFGHVVPLAYAKLNANGTATLVLMDENQEPPGSPTGEFRTFTLAEDGTIGWSSAYTTYYDPPSGRVEVDELLSIRDFSFFNFPFAARRSGGTVPGKLEGDGRTWVGRFEPPSGLPGPFLLVTKATDASGHTQTDYQYVGEPSRE
jgi:hypothetical protein